jgi:hypothetical protein
MKKFKGVPVKVLRPLVVKQPYVAGKPQQGTPIVDKEGTWVQVEILRGVDKGNRRPLTLEQLT